MRRAKGQMLRRRSSCRSSWDVVRPPESLVISGAADPVRKSLPLVQFKVRRNASAVKDISHNIRLVTKKEAHQRIERIEIGHPSILQPKLKGCSEARK